MKAAKEEECMKTSRIKSIMMLISTVAHVAIQPNFLSTFKGIGHTVEHWGKDLGSKQFWEKIGQGFGASPTGYVYSCTVQNDTQETIHIGVQEMASAMGAVFPKADGWSSTPVSPFDKHSINNKEYYFELTVNASSKEPSNKLPYVNSDALYIQDCIQLPKEKHSTKMNYMRSYIGKSLVDGQYVHGLRAEYLGYADPANPEDKSGTIKLGSVISSLVVYNNTSTDLLVGYSSQQEVPSLTKKDCDVFLATLEDGSFALFSPSTKEPLESGSICVFEKDSDKAVKIFSLPKSIFQNKKYTIELYQDGQQDLQIGLQGLMPGHYDVPTGKVRDITPLTGMFWYQTAKKGKKNSGMIDLPGKVWVVFAGDQTNIIEEVIPGEVLEFRFARPNFGVQQWIYFIYVDTKNEKEAEQFVQRFVDGAIGSDAIESFQQQSSKQMSLAHKNLTKGLSLDRLRANQQVPESLLVEAVQGALKVHQGRIEDKALGVKGYLLGADVFLSQGVGAGSTFYYTLAPSMQTAGLTPTSSVQNAFAYTLGGGKPPKGIPQPSKSVGIPKRVVPKAAAPKIGSEPVTSKKRAKRRKQRSMTPTADQLTLANS